MGNLPMLQALFLSVASAAGGVPTPSNERLGVYVLSAIFGVLVCGIISCAKEMRAEKAART